MEVLGIIVYKATNIINGKVYIGKTVGTLEKRKTQHKSDAKQSNPKHKFSRALKKYGFESFQWETVYNGLSNEEICKEEISLISFYDSIKNGYNTTIGGGGVSGFKHNNETKIKISSSRMGLGTGENHHLAKLNDEKVREIKNLLLENIPQREIAKRFNVTKTVIGEIQKGRLWSNVLVDGFEPYFKDNKGEGNSNAKLSDLKVAEIKKLLIKGDISQSDIAKKYDISKHVVSKIKLGKIWKHVKIDGEETLGLSYKKMTKEDEKKIEELLKQGLSARKIALLVGFNKDLIRKIKIAKKGDI